MEHVALNVLRLEKLTGRFLVTDQTLHKKDERIESCKFWLSFIGNDKSAINIKTKNYLKACVKAEKARLKALELQDSLEKDIRRLYKND